MTHGLAAAQSQVKNTESTSPYHRKSQSLDAATIAAQLLNGSSDTANVNKRKSYTHNEKFVQFSVIFIFLLFILLIFSMTSFAIITDSSVSFHIRQTVISS